jgi:hypothetical protein
MPHQAGLHSGPKWKQVTVLAAIAPEEYSECRTGAAAKVLVGKKMLRHHFRGTNRRLKLQYCWREICALKIYAFSIALRLRRAQHSDMACQMSDTPKPKIIDRDITGLKYFE